MVKGTCASEWRTIACPSRSTYSRSLDPRPASSSFPLLWIACGQVRALLPVNIHSRRHRHHGARYGRCHTWTVSCSIFPCLSARREMPQLAGPADQWLAQKHLEHAEMELNGEHTSNTAGFTVKSTRNNRNQGLPSLCWGWRLYCVAIAHQPEDGPRVQSVRGRRSNKAYHS